MSSLALCRPSSLYIQMFCLLWELHFKSLTNAFVFRKAEMILLSPTLSRFGDSFCIFFLWDFDSISTGQGYLGLRALDPHNLRKQEKKKISYKQTSYLLYKRLDGMCASSPRTNIWFQTSVLLNHVCILFPAAECVCCFYCFQLFFHQMSHHSS